MTVGARQLFIYWRVLPGALDAALDAARHLQTELRQVHAGLDATVFERADGDPTLMEIYAIPGGVDARLQTAIERQMAPGLAAWADGARHAEVFIPR